VVVALALEILALVLPHNPVADLVITSLEL
jgi:hypothetical protein